MKLFIVRNQEVGMNMKPYTSDGCQIDMNDGRPNVDVFTTFYEEGVMTLQPELFPYNGTPDVTSFYDKIRTQFPRQCLRLGIKPDSLMELRLSFRTDWSSMKEYREAHDNSKDQVNVGGGQHCEGSVGVKWVPLKGLGFLSKFNCRLGVNIQVFYVDRGWVKDISGRPCQRSSGKQLAGMIMAAGMTLNFPPNTKGQTVCHEVKVKLPNSFCSRLRFDPCENLVEFSAKVSIVLVVENFEFPKSLTQITEKFAGATDFTLISTDGSRFPCHKVILAEHSEVFKAFFSQGDQGSKANELVMKGMSSGVIDAFLKYLYVSAIDEPDKNPGLALELLKAGRKYRISKLEADMAKILKAMLPVEFNPDVAREMLSYACNIGQAGETLKAKANSVLKAVPRHRKR